MGWRNGFDRARRLSNIQALGDQVARLRRARFRGEYLVPLLALVIFGIALGLSRIPGEQPQADITPVAETTTAVADGATAIATETAVAGYPSTSEPTPTLFPTTVAITDTIAPDDTAVAGNNGYPGMDDGPQGVGPGSDDDLPQPNQQPTPPPVATFAPPIGTPQLLPPTAPAGGGSGYPTYPTRAPVAPQPRPTNAPRPTQPANQPGTNPTSPSGYPGSDPTPANGTTPTSDPNDPNAPAASPTPDGTTTPVATPDGASPTPEATAAPTTPPAPPTPTPRAFETLSGNVRWTAANSPYTLTRDQLIAAGSTLTIDPGVEVRLGPNVQLAVAGTLRAQGTANAPIKFVGTGARWDGLVGTQGSAITLDHVQIQQAGNNGTAVSSTNGSLTIRNSELRDNGGSIVTIGSALELERVNLIGNDMRGPAVDVQLPSQGVLALRGNVIGGNRAPQGAPQVRVAARERTEPIAIEGNLIIGNAGPGVIIDTAAPLTGIVRCNGFDGGTVGLQLSTKRPDLSGFALAIDQNAFAAQTTYGATGTLAFNLTNNWWGDPSGPNDARGNPQGRGVPVGVNIQVQPWLSGRPECAPRQ